MGGNNSCLLPEESLKGSLSKLGKSTKKFIAGEENVEETEEEEMCVDEKVKKKQIVFK